MTDNLRLGAEGERPSSGGLSDVVYEGLLADMAAGRFPSNAKLPPEHSLAETYGVSRPIVRDALARMRDEGLVISRKGSGTYVVRIPSNAALQLVPVSSIADMQRCFEFRIGLEGEIAALAARGSPDALRPLGRALSTLEQAVQRGELGVEEDFAFHAAMAHATENRFHQSVLASMRPSVEAGMTVTRSLSLLRPRPNLDIVHAEHVALHDAIVSADADRARAAARRHLENARRRVFEGIDGDNGRD